VDRLVVTGGSLTRRPQKSLRCFLAETTWKINKQNCITSTFNLMFEAQFQNYMATLIFMNEVKNGKNILNKNYCDYNILQYVHI